MLSDLVGVPDLFRRVGPVLRSSLPFREAEPSVAQLKPWVRRVVAGWVFLLVPVLAINLGYFLLAAPRIFATGWDSAGRLIGVMTSSPAAEVAWAGVQLVLLLPAVGVTYTFLRIARRGTRGAWGWSAGSAPRRAAVVGGALGLATLLAVLWYPDGRMTPYRPGERGTLQEHIVELGGLGQGDPRLRPPDEVPAPPAGQTDPVVIEEPAPTVPTGNNPPPTAPPAPTPAPTPPPAPPPPAQPTDAGLPAPPADVPDEVEDLAPELTGNLPDPAIPEPQDLPVPAVPGTEDLPPVTAEVRPVTDQITSAVNVPTEVVTTPGAPPAGVIPGG